MKKKKKPFAHRSRTNAQPRAHRPRASYCNERARVWTVRMPMLAPARACVRACVRDKKSNLHAQLTVREHNNDVLDQRGDGTDSTSIIQLSTYEQNTRMPCLMMS